ncbi:MAG: hypothetical protein IKT91_02395 [Clostridia bacterium]|nr:hypothetical protein [Clostridia bacterium]
MKKVAFALLLCLLLAGCQTPAEQETSLEEGISPGQSAAESSAESVITEISLPEESSESSSEELSLPETPAPYSLHDVLLFSFPEGWQNQGDSDSLFAVSPDGTASVQGSFTPLATMQGLTGEMLASSAAPALQKAWEDSGFSGATSQVITVSLCGTEHSAVSLQGVLEGTAVFQWQIYLPLADGYLTLTVTSYDQDIRADLMKHFSVL